LRFSWHYRLAFGFHGAHAIVVCADRQEEEEAEMLMERERRAAQVHHYGPSRFFLRDGSRIRDKLAISMQWEEQKISMNFIFLYVVTGPWWSP
jgi:hypothetical protein